MGLPTELEWEVEGASIGPIAWPIPEVFSDSGKLTSYGYENEVLLSVPLTFENGSSGQRTVSVSARFAACRVRCIPGRLALSRTLLVTKEVDASDDEMHAIFQHHAARVPGTEERSVDEAIDFPPTIGRDLSGRLQWCRQDRLLPSYPAVRAGSTRRK